MKTEIKLDTQANSPYRYAYIQFEREFAWRGYEKEIKKEWNKG